LNLAGQDLQHSNDKIRTKSQNQAFIFCLLIF